MGKKDQTTKTTQSKPMSINEGVEKKGGVNAKPTTPPPPPPKGQGGQSSKE